jgi:hypothetical protein
MTKKLTIVFMVCLLVAINPVSAQKIFWWKKDKKETKEEPARTEPQKETQPVEQPVRQERNTPQPETAPQDNRGTRETTRENSRGSRERGSITPEVTEQINRDNARIIDNSNPVVTDSPNGSVNWTEQYIEAKGVSVVDSERFTNTAQAKAMATRGAVVVAQRNLLEIIQGVQVTSETVVIDMVTTSDVINTKVEGVIKGAVMFGDPVEKDGLIEVIMRVPLYGQNGLANAIFDGIPNQSAYQVESKYSSVEEMSEEAKNALLGSLVFDYKGQKIDPSMFPVIIDENNNLLLDLSKLYDPKKGKFPAYINASRDLLEGLGYSEGVNFIDVLATEPGLIKVDTGKAKNINWAKIGEIAGAVGKFLLLFL